MSLYVDGYVLPIPKKNLAAYKKMANIGAKVWLEHGALEYYECIEEDVKAGKLTSFPQSVKLKKGEVVFFSWIIYKSRTHRDKVLKKVMTDPRMKMPVGGMSFDMERMIQGGFKTVVVKKKAK